jgi:hypothetical protein
MKNNGNYQNIQEMFIKGVQNQLSSNSKTKKKDDSLKSTAIKRKAAEV